MMVPANDAELAALLVLSIIAAKAKREAISEHQKRAPAYEICTENAVSGVLSAQVALGDEGATKGTNK